MSIYMLRDCLIKCSEFICKYIIYTTVSKLLSTASHFIWQWMICCMRKLLVEYVFHSLSFWIYEYSKENLPICHAQFDNLSKTSLRKIIGTTKITFFHLAHHSYKINKTTINNDITRLQNIYSPLFSTI